MVIWRAITLICRMHRTLQYLRLWACGHVCDNIAVSRVRSEGLRLAQGAARVGVSGKGVVGAAYGLWARRSYSIPLFPLRAQSVSAGKRVL